MKKRVELFERFGGPEVGALARRRFFEEKGQPDEATIAEWRRLAMPHYTRKPREPDAMRRAIIRPDVLQWFARPEPDAESGNFNILADLSRVVCPTLVMGGEDDPMHPIESQAEIAAALSPNLVRFERFPGCGHGVIHDDPQRGFVLIREFITR